MVDYGLDGKEEVWRPLDLVNEGATIAKFVEETLRIFQRLLPDITVVERTPDEAEFIGNFAA